MIEHFVSEDDVDFSDLSQFSSRNYIRALEDMIVITDYFIKYILILG